MSNDHIFVKNLIEFIYSNHFKGVGGTTASSQLSQLNTVTAQAGSTKNKDVDEFDMLAQSRNIAQDPKPA